MDSNSDLIIVQQDRNFSISPTSVKSGGFLAVSWNMPVDEASSKDWIGMVHILYMITFYRYCT